MILTVSNIIKIRKKLKERILDSLFELRKTSSNGGKESYSSYLFLRVEYLYQ